MEDNTITLLVSAAEALSNATNISEDSEQLKKIAYNINYASKYCGETSCIYTGSISDTNLEKLASNKYKVVCVNKETSIDGSVYEIYWDEESQKEA